MRQEPDSGERDYMYVIQVKQVLTKHSVTALIKMRSGTFMVVSL
jgi:hypothetical protein